MFAKVVFFLFAGCAVALARPQNSNTLQQAQQLLNPNTPQQFNQLQGLNPNQLQGINPNQLQALISGQLQGLNQNQLQALISSQLQGLNQNQLQGLNQNQLQGLNPNLFQGLNPNLFQGSIAGQLQGFNPNQLQNLFPGLNNGLSGYNNGNGNSQYKSPILDLPNHAIDWGQNVVDGGVSQVGSALAQAFGNTERVANNAIDTVGEVGRRGFQDGSNLFKSGLGIFTSFPKIGLGLLSRQNNNNNNNGFGL